MLTFKVLNGIMIGLFCLAGLLQYDDPDPVRWMTIYFGAALLSFRFASPARGHWLAPLILALFAFGWAMTMVPDVVGRMSLRDFVATMDSARPEIETGREMAGLLIVACWMAVLAARSLKRRRARQ